MEAMLMIEHELPSGPPWAARVSEAEAPGSDLAFRSVDLDEHVRIIKERDERREDEDRVSLG